MRTLRISIPLFLLAVMGPVRAQVINGYAQVTAIAGTVITIGSSNEAGGSFTVGKDVVLMQMQDNVIGTNTANNASFGDLSTIGMVGRYEIRRIMSVSRTGPTLTSVTVNVAPNYSYSIGANASVQLITHELRGGGGDFTTTSAISALPWNGTLGGVVALQVGGKLRLGHNITADGAGFRGGARDVANFTSPCDGTTFRTTSTGAGTDLFATKGEGIYRLTNTAWADGRGKIINGGGGGNKINAGGGGGGNVTAGGNAGLGWSCTVTAGGIGGIGLQSHISGLRIFMGGGGGGGEGNDNVSSAGGNGGGIILLDVGGIATTGACSVRISANGASAGNSGNDGAGAGGAGGTIVLNCDVYAVVPGCPLTISANGGNGGSVMSSTHGGGGGGGQGAVIYSGVQPTGNITTSTLNGTGGCDQNPCATRAGSGTGAGNSGILVNANNTLPIELVAFTATAVEQRVRVQWTTASEFDNTGFTVERSGDSERWDTLEFVPGMDHSTQLRDYAVWDDAPLPRTSYYRLRQTDHNGSFTLSDVVQVHFDHAVGTITLFPNPARDRVMVVHDAQVSGAEVRLSNMLGQELIIDVLPGEGRTEVDLSGVPGGAYLISFRSTAGIITERLIVDR